jgi:hypothetical protein
MKRLEIAGDFTQKLRDLDPETLRGGRNGLAEIGPVRGWIEVHLVTLSRLEWAAYR